VCGQGDEIGTHGADIPPNSARGLDRVDVQEAARGVDEARRLRDGLDDAGFVVGGHDRHQRSVPERSEALFERRKVDLAILSHRQALDVSGREPTARKHRGMLDRGG
jgi:hypothetical protein